MFNKTHTRKDGKVDINLITVTQDGTAIYHRQWKNGEKTVTALWGACHIDRINSQFNPVEA